MACRPPGQQEDVNATVDQATHLCRCCNCGRSWQLVTCRDSWRPRSRKPRRPRRTFRSWTGRSWLTRRRRRWRAAPIALRSWRSWRWRRASRTVADRARRGISLRTTGLLDLGRVPPRRQGRRAKRAALLQCAAGLLPGGPKLPGALDGRRARREMSPAWPTCALSASKPQVSAQVRAANAVGVRGLGASRVVTPLRPYRRGHFCSVAVAVGIAGCVFHDRAHPAVEVGPRSWLDERGDPSCCCCTHRRLATFCTTPTSRFGPRGPSLKRGPRERAENDHQQGEAQGEPSPPVSQTVRDQCTSKSRGGEKGQCERPSPNLAQWRSHCMLPTAALPSA